MKSRKSRPSSVTGRSSIELRVIMQTRTPGPERDKGGLVCGADQYGTALWESRYNLLHL